MSDFLGMESFNNDNVSSSINAQLNYGIHNARKINSHIQTGKRVNEAKDDAAAFSVSTKINSELKQKIQRVQNLQNSLSFLQVQDGALKTAGKIITRISELKTLFEAPTFNATDKAAYDEEFKELQIQLKKIRESKFNGVSLFCSANDKNVTEKSQNPSNLRSTAGNVEGEIVLNRAGFLGAMKVSKPFEVENSTVDADGGPSEKRVAIDLKNHSGKLTFWQWPYGVPDNFRVYHDSSLIHDKTYGNLGQSRNLNDGRTITPSVQSFARPGDYDKNMDIIPFGQDGNKSRQMELVMNESGFTFGSTGWEIAFKIEYDPLELDILDDSVVWSLKDFEVQDFDTCLANLASARAENGATQNRLKGEISELQSNMVSIEGHKERSEGLDIARAIGELNAVRTRLTINANLMKSAQEMENKLYTDFL